MATEDLRSLLADIVLVVHAAYVFFVVGGQLSILAGWARGWSWTRHRLFRLLHVLAIGLVTVEAWLGAACPLTVAENALRSAADGGAYETTFLTHWLGRVIFYTAPEWVFTAIYTVFALVVILTWVLYPPRRKF